MAVYERAYRRYCGELTSPRWRFAVITRDAVEDVFRSRLFLLAFAAGFVVPAAAVAFIYVRHNVTVLAPLGVTPEMLGPIDAEFFLGFLSVQAAVTAYLALLVGPALIAQDLADNALPLYLCRPFSRTDYVLGKASVLGILLSILTWIAGLLLVALQATLGGRDWLAANWRLGWGVVIGSIAWVFVLTLVTLAVSGWVRRRTFARATLVALTLVPMAMGNAINGILETYWGDLLNFGALFRAVWLGLFGLGDSGLMQDALLGPQERLPVWCAWLVLALVCAASLWLLHRKLRAYEVARS